MEDYLNETQLLDYSHKNIQQLIKERKWNMLDETMRVKSIYNFVRNEIKFGYNMSDYISASAVLKESYGQCNTKSVLLMALLRGTGIQARLHGFTIDKALQKGAITGIWYKLSPQDILHSWVEVLVNGQWYITEGVILDNDYLKKLQRANPDFKNTFCGFGVYTDNFQNPVVDWDLNNTFIQERGINNDYGLFDTPDEFYSKYRQKLNFIKQIVYRYIVRHLMNNNVRKIRNK